MVGVFASTTQHCRNEHLITLHTELAPQDLGCLVASYHAAYDQLHGQGQCIECTDAAPPRQEATA